MFGASSVDSGRGLESSLDAVLQSTQESIDRVEAAKQRTPGMRGSWSGSLTSNSKAPRPSSTGRPARAMATTPLPEDKDRGYEVLVKKLKTLEDRIKKTETSNSTISVSLSDLNSSVEKLSEAQRADRKVLLGLKEVIAGVRTRTDLLLSTEAMKEKLSSSTSSAVPLGLDDLIAQRVAAEVSRAMSRIRDQTENLPTPPATSSKNTSSQPNKALLEGISALEKEVLRLKADNDRMRTKQSYLDGIYSELKETVSTRELKASDENKRLFNQYKLDLEALKTNATDRITEVLAALRNEEHQHSSLQEGLEQHIDNTATLMAQWDGRLGAVEEALTGLGNTQSLAQGRVQEIEDRLQELESTSTAILQDVEIISSLKDTLHDHSKGLDTLCGEITTTQSELSALHQLIAEQQASEEIEREATQERVVHLTAQLQHVQATQTDGLRTLKEAVIKLKLKLKYATSTATSTASALSAHQGSVDHALQVLEQGIKDEKTARAAAEAEMAMVMQRVTAQMVAVEGHLADKVEQVVSTRMEEEESYRATWSTLLVGELNSQLAAYDTLQGTKQTATEGAMAQIRGELGSVLQQVHALEESAEQKESRWRELDGKVHVLQATVREAGDGLKGVQEGVLMVQAAQEAQQVAWEEQKAAEEAQRAEAEEAKRAADLAAEAAAQAAQAAAQAAAEAAAEEAAVEAAAALAVAQQVIIPEPVIEEVKEPEPVSKPISAPSSPPVVTAPVLSFEAFHHMIDSANSSILALDCHLDASTSSHSLRSSSPRSNPRSSPLAKPSFRENRDRNPQVQLQLQARKLEELEARLLGRESYGQVQYDSSEEEQPVHTGRGPRSQARPQLSSRQQMSRSQSKPQARSPDTESDDGFTAEEQAYIQHLMSSTPAWEEQEDADETATLEELLEDEEVDLKEKKAANRKRFQANLLQRSL